MNTNRKKQVGLLLIVVMIAGLLVLVTGGDVVKADAPITPLPADSVWYGDSYAGWAAKWWQWAVMLKANEEHPLIADGEMDCSLGQEGDVWFLGGTYSESGQAQRVCEVPYGKALFFPVVNVICSEFTGDDPNALLECAADPPVPEGFEVEVNPLSATIDGKRVNYLKKYYTLSEEPFDMGPLPNPNLFGVRPGSKGPGATSGYYLMFAPLEAGVHDITFAGEILILDPDGVPVYHFIADISYQLTVVGD